MTVSSTTVKNSASGDGSTTGFTYSFKIFADTDLEVIIRSSTGTETIKLLSTHYTVSGVGDASGGSVTFTVGNIPASGETVVIKREVPQTQAIDYIANDPFPAESHEEGLDRATMTIQQMQEALDRSFKVSATNSITTPEFTDDAATRASKTLGFDSTGQVLTTVADFLPAGGDSAMFQYSTTTADADPGAGKFRLNNATISSATIMYIDDLEFNGTDVSAWVQSWDDVAGNDTNRGRIRISKANTLDTWMVFKVTGAITDATGYSKISLVYIDSAGTFANDDKVFVSFVASGEDGAIPGYLYNFDTGTSDTDPGAGEIAFNNGTYASATVIFIDDADQNGVTVSTDILTWDDSTSTIRGNLMIYDINDRSTYARFNITGASTDASGYVKLAVTHVASNNTFSAADELSVHFSRSGNKGDTGNTGATGSQGPTGDVSLAGTETLSNKTLTAPKIVDGGFIADANGNEALVFQTTGSAINELEITNNAAGNNPILAATGGDTNIGINLTPKGTGEIVIGSGNLNYAGTAVTATGAELNKLASAGTLKQAGKETMWVPAAAMYGATTNPADAQQVETTAVRPDMKVLDFDASTDEFAQFSVAFPKSWNEGTITYQVYWTPASTNTGDCIFGLQGVSCGDNDTIDVAYGTAINVTDAGIGTVEDQQVSAESSAVTIAGSPAVDQLTYFQLFRDANAGGDTFSADARVLGIKIFFTTDAANDA